MRELVFVANSNSNNTVCNKTAAIVAATTTTMSSDNNIKKANRKQEVTKMRTKGEKQKKDTRVYFILTNCICIQCSYLLPFRL